MMRAIFSRALGELSELLPKLGALEGQLERLGEIMMECWADGGKLLIAGNGGSAADAMHFAEELVVRFGKNRKALAAIALCDPAVLTCAANDFGYESVFERQVEALGRKGDLLVVMTTSGNSPNLRKAIALAKARELRTAGFLGKDGGPCRGLCDVELLIPCQSTARIQEAHKLLYHTLCEWVEERLTR